MGETITLPGFTTGNRTLDLYILFVQCSRAVVRVRERELKPAGVQAGHAGVLFALMGNGGSATEKEISEWLLRERHSIVGIINRMERSGLITRGPDPHDTRLTRVSVTEKGVGAWRALPRPSAAAALFSRLPRKDLPCFERCLRALLLQSMNISHEQVLEKPVVIPHTQL